jgi:hypothetical protein
MSDYFGILVVFVVVLLQSDFGFSPSGIRTVLVARRIIRIVIVFT